MNLSGLLPLIEQLSALKDLAAILKNQTTTSADLIESARAPVLSALSHTSNAPIIIVTARSDRAKQLTEEINIWADRVIGHLFAEPDPLFYERMPWSTETVAARLGTLAGLAGTSAPIVVSSVRALMQRTVPPDHFRAGIRVLSRGDKINLIELLSVLIASGYTNEVVVGTPGEFSRRGGIFDIWSASNAQPVRIELVGDEIASLRLFDPASQRSAQEIDAVTIAPASEALPGRGRALSPERKMSDKLGEMRGESARSDALKEIEKLDLSACHPIAASAFKQDRDALEEGQRFRGIEFYLQYFYSDPASLLDHLSGGLLVLENWSEIEATAQSLEFQAEDVRGDLEARRELPPHVLAPYFSWDALREQILSHRRLLLDYASPGESIHFPFTPNERYGGQLRKVIDEIKSWRAEKSRIVLVTRQSERLAGLMRERDLYAKPIQKITDVPEPGYIVLVQGALAEGWKLLVNSDQSTVNSKSLITENCLLLTDAELFGWSRPKPRRVAQTRSARGPEAFFADLAVGDHVVHVDHGIGIFRGLVRIGLNGPEREYVLIEYAHGDRLYVPVHQIDRLGRYVGPDGRPPTLNRMGTAEWAQVKERTRRAVEDIALELLELYAAREVVPGHAFSPDNPWQHELEASFPYVETEDQLHAVDEAKADMERARPMDRLVVGDVGYGKTEVALRVAFKAVMDGKQVALLVPTTVLAQQHFNTFKERLAPFPIQIEMLSRFRSDKEQNEIVEKIKGGAVDIVVGTHRLLSNDVEFKDLGLLVVDEEQRFGVVHKERLKQLRKEVDVLTLTATPIPRTLYLSLSGARDMSTIDTAPEDRLPIRTYVAEYDERLVRDSILRELDRGGQVFFVHNRVRGIQIITEQLRKLVPEANIAIGHGQMREDQLEQVMLEFAQGKHDVLVCTTIIESGLDIPNANTIIINHADKFGLSQLYQLRGRVGRSAARAYAYFLYEKNHPLSEEARARLQAIAEATELGAGFQIAMRDLEIRGAGEILGARQHGHIAAVGFDLYCRLLASAIEQAKAKSGEAKSEKRNLGFAPTIDLPLQAHIPDDYVRDSGLRLKLYRRLADISTEAQIDDVARELQDRFGPPPEQVENLLYLLRVKVASMHARIEAVAMEDGRIVIKFGREDSALGSRLKTRFDGRVQVARDRAWLPGPGSDFKWQEHLVQVVSAAVKSAE